MKLLFFQSSLGKKYVMAITGIVLFIFVIMHMLGNLQIFLGPAGINTYAEFLHTNPGLLWSARLGLLIMIALHIAAAVKLSAENRAARPVNYATPKFAAASYASRTMLMSGLIVFVFIIYHLLHFTVQAPGVHLLGPEHPDLPTGRFVDLQDPLAGPNGRHDVYRMMVVGFSSFLVSGFYIVGVALLMLHLSHGVSSMFQSLGLNNKRYGRLIDRFALGAAILIFAGYISIPLAVLADRRLNLFRIFE
jgi:succinate dehydrogenase / fumarate reductase, cytochrome b subunit